MLMERDLPVSGEHYDKHATIYSDSEVPPKGCILYFHGGGLLYGTRTDLPQLHRELLTQAGYRIIAFDYPLAPAARLDSILPDVCASIHDYLANFSRYTGEKLPYFLWGRSAGAYLCLLAAARGTLQEAPMGILSYYGYGFLCDGWFLAPSSYYHSFPAVGETSLRAIPAQIHAVGDLETHYSAYVYARQTGRWIDLIYSGRQKFFYLDYTLRGCTQLPCPLFCAHSTGDTDVPYGEFLELCSRFQPQRFVTSHSQHDFDRDERSPVTTRLLEATVKFLDLRLSLLTPGRGAVRET